MNVLLFTMALILTITLIAGCASSNSETKEQSNTTQKNNTTTEKVTDSSDEVIELRMTWWGSQNRHDRTLKVIDLFEQEYPNIKISPEFSGWEGYWEKLATQAAGKNLPDIIQMDMQYLAEYSSRELLVDLNPYVETGIFDISDIDDIYLSGGRVNGSLFAVNIGANALAMAVDPAMYKTAGLSIPQSGYTWEDFMDDARILKEKLGDDVFVKDLTGGHEFRHYLRGYGEEIYSPDGLSLGYEDDQYLIDFFTMKDKLLKEGVTASPELTSMVQGLEDELIVQGKSPNHFFHSNQIIALVSAANRPLEMVIYPSVASGEFGHYLKPGQFLSATTHSEHPEEAATFINFFTNSIAANEILAGERGVPIAAKVRESMYPTLDEVGQGMFDYMDEVAKYSREVPYEAPGAGTVMQAFDRAYEALAYGQMTPEQAAQSFREEANEILSRNAD